MSHLSHSHFYTPTHVPQIQGLPDTLETFILIECFGYLTRVPRHIILISMLLEKISQIKIFFILFGLVVISIICILLFKKTIPATVSPAATAIIFPVKTAINSPVEIKTNQEVKIEATIISVGDIFLHTNNLYSAFDSKNKTYDFDPVFSLTADYFKEADLSTAWLGGVMDNNGPYTGYPSFRSPTALVETLQNIGMDVVFRTNHTLDFGIKGFNTTTQILSEHKINQVAAYTSEESSKNIFIYEKGGLKIAFPGYIYGMNGIPIPKSWMINLIDLEKIKDDVIKARKQADFIVVALHFGNEYERYPSKWQKDTVKKIANFGADMIIGSHPHVLQPAEMIISVDGRKVFVAYGLGNFYCGQREHYTDAGMMLRYTIEKTEEGTKLKEINYIPTWVAEYKENGKNQYKILPSKKYLELYETGQADFISVKNYDRLKQTYQETVKHLDNPEIGFIEYKK